MLDTIDALFVSTHERQEAAFYPFWMLDPKQVAAHALTRLWEEKGYDGMLFLFQIKDEERLYHPELLDKVVQQGRRRKRVKPNPGQLLAWESVATPVYAAATSPLRKGIYRANLMNAASIYDRNTLPGPCIDGWFAYHFEGWSALSVLLMEQEEGEAVALVALPLGRQDDWLAFQRQLRTVFHGVLRRQRKSCIDVLGSPGDGSHDIEREVKQSTFDQVILPQELIDQVLSQRSIFQPEILKRYEQLRIPRLRKVLLIGPPGTGKTTLVKVVAAEHQRNGGYVVYVFAEDNEDRSWQRLRLALHSAVSSGLPTLVVVEDLENFVSHGKNMQAILNTLDGVATPDNQAGTLLLATTNAPDRIDPRITQRPGRIDVMIEIGAIKDETIAIRLLERFLHTAYDAKEHNPVARKFIGQVGSHVREVCLLAAIHTVEQKRDGVMRDDLLWANEAILTGRKAAANLETCEPPKAASIGGVGFGKNGA